MAGDFQKLLELYKTQIADDFKRLNTSETGLTEKDGEARPCDSEKHQQNNNVEQSVENKENLPVTTRPSFSIQTQKQGLVESQFVNCDILTRTPGTCVPQSSNDHREGRSMLRYGEYSPNNPDLLKVPASAPYLGLGEYERRRNILVQKRRDDYLDYLKTQCNITSPKSGVTYYTLNSDSQNALLKPEMDKPKSILSNRRNCTGERLLSDVKNSYTPDFLDGFSYQDPCEELEREKMKRENYQRELMLQIEEKRRLHALRDDQERREQELENKRLQHQLLRMQEEQAIDSHRDEQMRRHSDDLLRRKYEMQSSFRKHGFSESSAAHVRNTNVASRTASHYSPPVSRRNLYPINVPSSSMHDTAAKYSNSNPFDSYRRKSTLNRMDSINMYDTHHRHNAFTRYDSLGRIDALNRQDTLNRIESLNIQDSLSNVQRRHSATQQDLRNLRQSPKLQRRNSAGRFDDSFPVPLLNAHSPVAKELKNSIPFKSSRYLEDKWQIPVQKNYVNHESSSRDGSRRNILSHLGAIRMQLRQEQLRMDETLRNRDIIQSKAVDFH